MGRQQAIFRRLTKQILIAVGLTAVIATTWAVAQQATTLTISHFMTSKEMEDTGVNTLSPKQRAALDAWLNRYTLHVIQVLSDRNESSNGTSSRCNPAIESSIAGEFHGWDGETIFKLSNGQIWQQAEYDYTYSYSYAPDVTIYSTASGCRLKVEDEDETILVKRIK